MPIVAGQGMGEYCVDIVMCIDATGSMAPIINEVKDNAMSFYQQFIDSMEENDKDVAELRIKVTVIVALIIKTSGGGLDAIWQSTKSVVERMLYTSPLCLPETCGRSFHSVRLPLWNNCLLMRK